MVGSCFVCYKIVACVKKSECLKLRIVRSYNKCIVLRVHLDFVSHLIYNNLQEGA